METVIDRVGILNGYYLEKKHILLKSVFTTVHRVRVMYMIVITQTDIHSAAILYFKHMIIILM